MIDLNVWTKLADSPPTGEALRARRPAPVVTDKFFAAIDSSGLRHWLIQVNASETPIEDRSTRGLGVVTKDWLLGGTTQRFIDVACLDSAGYRAFDLVGDEILTGLAAGGQSPAAVVAKTLGRWRRFWGQIPRDLLSLEQLLGLFGELFFLVEWLLPTEGIKAVYAWRGPFGSRHDFEWPHHSVEVKTSASSRGQVHRISGLEQLEPPGSGDLNLFALSVRLEAGGGHTLPGVVSRLRAAVAGEPEVLGQLDDALGRVGYSPAHDGEYEKTILRIADEAVFTVQADFPRLTPYVLKPIDLRGIERVDYEINLGAFGHLIVCRGRPYPPSFLTS